MASSSKLHLTIGCNGKEEVGRYQKVHLSAILSEEKLNPILSHYRKILNMKKMPMLVLQVPGKLSEKVGKEFTIFGQKFQTKANEIEGDTFIWGELLNKEKATTLKKIQKILHLVTSLPNQAEINFNFYDFENKNLEDLSTLLQQSIIEGSIEIPPKTIQVLKKCIGKVSPQFNQSPIMGFLEIFEQFDFRLNLDSLEILEEQSREKLLEMLKLKTEQEEIIRELKSGQVQGQTKIYITAQKLFTLSLAGPSQLMGAVLSFL